MKHNADRAKHTHTHIYIEIILSICFWSNLTFQQCFKWNGVHFGQNRSVWLKWCIIWNIVETSPAKTDLFGRNGCMTFYMFAIFLFLFFCLFIKILLLKGDAGADGSGLIDHVTDQALNYLDQFDRSGPKGSIDGPSFDCPSTIHLASWLNGLDRKISSGPSTWVLKFNTQTLSLQVLDSLQEKRIQDSVLGNFIDCFIDGHSAKLWWIFTSSKLNAGRVVAVVSLYIQLKLNTPIVVATTTRNCWTLVQDDSNLNLSL